MSETPPRAPSSMARDALKQMALISKLLCPVQQGMEYLVETLEKKENDDSMVPRKDYDAMAQDVEGLKKQVAELSSVHASMKNKIDTLQTERNELDKRLRAQEKDRQDSDRIRARMDRYLSERDRLRDEQSGWEREKVSMGHRFLNWLLENHSVSHSAAADLAIRAWMDETGILANASAGPEFELSDGFSVGPGKPGVPARLLSLPQPPPKSSGPDKDSDSRGSTTGKNSSSSGASARAARPGGKSTDKAPQKSKPTPTKSDGHKRARDSPDFDASELDFGVGAKSAKPGANGSDSEPKSSPKEKTVSTLKDSDSGKKRPAEKSGADTAKRPRHDPPAKAAKTSGLTTKEMFGSDTDEEKPKAQGDTGKLIREIRDVYADVIRAKPWRRYQHAVGSFLPDIPDSAPTHPRHAESVATFNSALSDFWQRCAEDVWVRMFMTTGKSDTKAWERLIYHLTRLAAELYILIHNSDFKEDLIRFLCHPHPAWPQVFKNPINLLMIGKQQSPEVAVNYLLSQNSKFWPQVPMKSWSCPLGSTFLLLRNKNPGKSVSQVVAKRIIETERDYRGPFDKTDQAGHVQLTKEVIEFVCKVAVEYVEEKGYDFSPDTFLPFVTVRPQSDPDMPEQWFGKRPYPNTQYVWDGISNASFWEVQPDVNRIEESGGEEDSASQEKEASGADSEYEEEQA